jgi:hypothetical protein
MPIAATDVGLMLSVTSGTAGNSTAQPDPNSSLGKYISTTALSTTALDNLFNDISGAANAASQVDYRCLFIVNNHATLTMVGAAVWINTQVAGGATCRVAVDNIGPVSNTSSSAQAAQIATATTTPAGVTAFSSAASAPAALALGNIAPGQCRAVWIQRSAANTPPQNNGGLTLEIDFDTGA